VSGKITLATKTLVKIGSNKTVLGDPPQPRDLEGGRHRRDPDPARRHQGVDRPPLPSLRFGTGHAYDNYFRSVTDSAVHWRMNAHFLAQNNVFESTKTCLGTTGDSDVDGYLNES
jgi:pectate lyase